MQDDPRVRDILNEAADLPPGRRAAYLDAACGRDAGLRAEVESLLRSLDDSEEFLESPTVAPTPAVVGEDSPEDLGVIGPYTLLRRLGEGGMGVVYLAEQTQPVRRRVALKVIKPGMDSAAVVARFEAERQALALMDHSNIARVYDAATTPDGRPYFVMELVLGETVTRYCDLNRLSPEQRLELFIPICQAVQHAHQKGIIHRDLKPGNILVTVQDGRPVAKVIDFGIAKALHQPLTEKTVFTQLGMMIGTPEYMSPEQAGATADATDTRSDVYALGVVLYELLTGVTPLDRRQLLQAGYEQMMRTIREVDPPRPSTRLGVPIGEGVASASALRRMEPHKLAKLLTGDLDVIVMKCLEKDRTRRYETADGLARDIERFLNDDPVEASPPSTAYVLSKLARKYRRLLNVAAAFVGLVVTFLATTSVVFYVLSHEATHERNVAVAAKSAAETSKAAETVAKDEAVRGKTAAETESYFASIFAADAAVGHDNLSDANEFLNRAPAAMRNWEWRYLHAAANTQVLTIQFPQGIDGSGYIKHSTEIVSTYADYTIHFFDALTGKELRSITNLPKGLRPFTISQDGTRIIAEKRDLSLVVADDHGNVLTPVALELRAYVYTTLFTADNSQFVTSSPDNTVRLWDTKTGREIRRFPGHQSEVISTRWSHDETKLLTGTMDGTSKIFDRATGRCLATYHDPAGGWIYSAFGPDDKRVISSTNDPNRQATIWDAATGLPLESITEGLHTNYNMSASFSPDGKMIAVSGGMFANVFDAATGHPIAALGGHRGRVPGVAFSDDGVHLLTGSNDNTARVWRLDNPPRPVVIGTAATPVTDAEFADAGETVATRSTDGIARLIDAATGRPRHTFDAAALAPPASALRPPATFGPAAPRVAVPSGWSVFVADASGGAVVARLDAALPGATPVVTAFTHDGRRAVTGTSLGTLRVWDLATGRPAATLAGLGHAVRHLDVARGDERLVSLDGQGNAVLWDLAAGKKVRPLTGGMWTIAAGFSHDGRNVATVNADRSVYFWDSVNGQRVGRMYVGHADLHSAAFSPDDNRVVLTCQDDIAEVWDTESCKFLFELRGHQGCLLDARFSPDGSRIVTASQDGTARVWDAATGRELLALRGHAGPVRGAGFSPDGTKILTLSDDGTARVWDSVSNEERDRR